MTTSNSFVVKAWTDLKVGGDADVSQVPVHLAALREPDCPRWRHVVTLKCLYDDLKIYSAAAKAIPEVVEMLGADRTPHKDTLLVLLAATVCGRTQTRMVWGLDLRRPEIKSFYARGVAKDVWRATWSGRATYLALLDHQSAMVRASAAFLLAFDYEGAREVEAAVGARVLGEGDAKAKASMLLCLGYARQYTGSSALGSELGSELGAIASDPNAELLVRGAAILATLCSSAEPIALSSQDKSTLVDWCGQIKVNHNGYPWNGGIVDMHCARVVEGRCVEGGVTAAEILAEAIRRFGPQRRGSEWAEGVLELAFAPAAYALAAGPFMIDANVEQASAFTERQKALLVVLSSYSFAAPFLSYGIPAEVRDRRRWLGLDPAGPMERIVTVDVLGKKRTWPVWLCLKVQQASDPNQGVDVQSLLRDVLTPTELLEVRIEYSHNAYSLRLGGIISREVLERGQEMLPWAVKYLDDMARIFHEFGGTFSGGAMASLTAMNLLIQEGRAKDLLPTYDVLIDPSWRDILEALPLPRRENIITSRLRGTLSDDAQTMWSAGVRRFTESTLRNLELYPTELVAEALFDVRDHVVSRRFTEFLDLCTAIEEQCAKVAAEHRAFHAVVNRRLTRPA